jgi:hypothetical protein
MLEVIAETIAARDERPDVAGGPPHRFRIENPRS